MEIINNIYSLTEFINSREFRDKVIPGEEPFILTVRGQG